MEGWLLLFIGAPSAGSPSLIFDKCLLGDLSEMGLEAFSKI